MSDLDQFSEQPKAPEQAADLSPAKPDASTPTPAPAHPYENKKIFVFCDGTGNEFAGRPINRYIRHFWDRRTRVELPDGNSNVVKLYSSLYLNPHQIAYYHPGVGTMGDPSKKGVARLWSKIKGLAFGYGFQENVLDAYRYLMQHYNAGDTVYIFGFSRGAYTARALAGLLHGYGLLCRGNEGHLLYAWQMYMDGLEKARKQNQDSPDEGHSIKTDFSFRDTFSHPDFIIHFMGLWDTVSSIGWITTPIRLLHLAQNPSVVTGRHAISIDERRCFYHDNLWGEPVDVQVPPVLQGTQRGIELRGKQDILQVWFPGVHSDVGGSYPQCESGLANNALRWMMREVQKHGAVFDLHRRSAVFGLPVWNDPKGLTSGIQPLYPKPESSLRHNSMKSWWWLLEIFPHRFYDRDGQKKEKLRIPLGGRRHVPYGSLLHPSVFKQTGYPPKNLSHGEITKLPLSSVNAPNLITKPHRHDAIPPAWRLQELPGYGLYTFTTKEPKDWREMSLLVFLMKVALISIPMLIFHKPLWIMGRWMGSQFKTCLCHCLPALAAWLCKVWAYWGQTLSWPWFFQHMHSASIVLGWVFLQALVLVGVWEFIRRYIVPRR